MSLGTLYLLVDAPLELLLLLALLPLLRLGRWARQLRVRLGAGKTRVWPSYLRLALEIAAALVVLGGVGLLLHMMGAQACSEGFDAYPDLSLWVWALGLSLLLSGVGRLLMIVRTRRDSQVRKPLAPGSLPGAAPRHAPGR